MENSQIQEKVKGSHLPRNKKFFWVFFVLSAITLVLGIALLPVWSGTGLPWESWGTTFFSMILFAIIFVYIIGYLLKQIIREKKVAVKILTVFEAGFFFAIAIGCIMEQFELVSVVGPCTIVGAALWSRGFVYIVKAYLCKHDESDKYPLWMLIISVGLVTLGSIMMTREIFSMTHIVWAAAIILLLTALALFILGFISKPKVDKALKKLKKEQRKLKKEEKAAASLEKARDKQEKKKLKTQSKVDKLSEKVNAENALPALEAPKAETDEGSKNEFNEANS